MDTILQGLLDLAGVSAAMVFDGGGHVVGHRAHAVYDRNLCEQVCNALNKAVDSVQLQQDDWESISAQFADGRLLLRKVAASGGRKHVLVVVADATLNQSFATVAIRVAANKLKAALDGVAPGASGSAMGSQAAAFGSGFHPPPPAASQARAAGSGIHPLVATGSGIHVSVAPGSGVHPPPSSSALANSGLSWSKTSNVGISGISVADPASSAFLSRCVKELARHVGPISKVYVQEAVRKLSPEAHFALPLGGQLVEELAVQIEDPKDRAQFKKAIEKA